MVLKNFKLLFDIGVFYKKRMLQVLRVIFGTIVTNFQHFLGCSWG